MADRVVAFIDYENMHRSARARFGGNGHFDPWALGAHLVARKNVTGSSTYRLHQVRVYRGLPDARRQPRSNAANQAQTLRWRATHPSDDLHVYTRPLRYPPGWPAPGVGPPQEKGIDVALAVDLVQMAYQGAYDVAIVCSHDSDLGPALDVVRSVTTTRTHLEVVSWTGRKRVSYTTDPNLPWCHYLGEADFRSVEDSRA